MTSKPSPTRSRLRSQMLSDQILPAKLRSTLRSRKKLKTTMGRLKTKSESSERYYLDNLHIIYNTI